MSTQQNQERKPFERLLARRYGDGLIYLPKSMSLGVLGDAVLRGFVSEDGFLTRKGRNFLAEANTGTSVGE